MDVVVEGIAVVVCASIIGENKIKIKRIDMHCLVICFSILSVHVLL